MARFLLLVAFLFGLTLLFCADQHLAAQRYDQDAVLSPDRISIAAGELGDLDLDGVLSEPMWSAAPLIDGITMTEPVGGGDLIGKTEVRVLANAKYLVVGIIALDPDPTGIVSTSKSRDPQLRSEDHVKIVLDPFLDGRTGYIFAINPGGARYDALVARRGEGEDSQWDAVWEEATARGDLGWSAEVRIPLQSLTFDGSLD